MKYQTPIFWMMALEMETQYYSTGLYKLESCSFIKRFKVGTLGITKNILKLHFKTKDKWSNLNP